MDVRRQAISIESLKTEAPERIHAMLVGLVEKKTRDALIRLIEPAKAKVSEAAALSEHQLAGLPKAKLQEFAQQAGASNAAIQDALGNDQFFADADGDGQRDMNDSIYPTLSMIAKVLHHDSISCCETSYVPRHNHTSYI